MGVITAEGVVFSHNPGAFFAVFIVKDHFVKRAYAHHIGGGEAFDVRGCCFGFISYCRNSGYTVGIIIAVFNCAVIKIISGHAADYNIRCSSRYSYFARVITVFDFTIRSIISDHAAKFRARSSCSSYSARIITVCDCTTEI